MLQRSHRARGPSILVTFLAWDAGCVGWECDAGCVGWECRGLGLAVYRLRHLHGPLV